MMQKIKKEKNSAIKTIQALSIFYIIKKKASDQSRIIKYIYFLFTSIISVNSIISQVN